MMNGRYLLCLVSVIVFLPSLSPGQQVTLAPDRGLAGFQGVDSLLLMESVHKELQLSMEQVQRVKEIAREARLQRRGEFDGLLKQKQSSEERRSRVLEIMKQVSREVTEKVRPVLKPEQLRRLRQIELQEMGLRAFDDPEVVRTLQLTEAQKQRLHNAAEEAAEQMRKLFKEGPLGNYVEGLKAMRARRQQGVEHVLAVLTPEQRSAWKQLVGEPYESTIDRPNRVPGGVPPPERPPGSS
jgi:hypothetical protein